MDAGRRRRERRDRARGRRVKTAKIRDKGRREGRKAALTKRTRGPMNMTLIQKMDGTTNGKRVNARGLARGHGGRRRRNLGPKAGGEHGHTARATSGVK